MNFTIWVKWVAVMAAVVVAGAAFAGWLGGQGYAWEWWTLRTGFATVRWAVYVALGGGALALVAALLPPWRAAWRWRALALLAIAVSAGMGLTALAAQRMSDAAPPISEATTDPDDPPAFVAIVPLRAGARVPHEFGGARVAQALRAAYPAMRPIVLNLAPATAFARARVTAEAMGWTIIAAVEAEGRIEAVARTAWFRFSDDVVIRVRAEGGGARVDIRSKSRIANFDRGMNAARVLEFIRRMG